MVDVADNVQRDSDDTVNNRKEGEIRKDFEEVAGKIDVEHADSQSGPSAAGHVKDVLEKR